MSNLPVVLVHEILFSGPGTTDNIGKTRFYNFIAGRGSIMVRLMHLLDRREPKDV